MESARTQAESGQKRIQYLETVRGLACVLLVLYHVIGHTPVDGLRLPDGHWLRALNQAFGDIRMPLFSLISGLVFAPVVRSASEWGRKAGAKVRRLLLPMAVVGTLHFLVQDAVGEGEHLALLQIYYLPFVHFWFLQATFLLMAVFLTVNLLFRNPRAFPPIAAIACAAAYLAIPHWHPEIFSSYRAIWLGIYFFLGAAVAQSADLRANAADKTSVRTLSAVFLGVGACVVAAKLSGAVPHGLEKSAQLLVAGSVTLFALSWKPRFKPLVWIGRFSYAIYLFHVFFTAGSRIALRSVWNDVPILVLLATGVVAGLIGPVGIHWLALRSRVTALIFLGIDPKKYVRNRPVGGETATVQIP